MREEDAELVHVVLPEVDSVEWLDLREQAVLYRSLVPSILYLTWLCALAVRALRREYRPQHLIGSEMQTP